VRCYAPPSATGFSSCSWGCEQAAFANARVHLPCHPVPASRICIRPPRVPPPSQLVSNLVLTDYDTSTALLYDASTAEGAGPSASIALTFTTLL
jgi:hypothetical protein